MENHRSKRKALPWVIGALAVVLLVCGGGLVAMVATAMNPGPDPFVVRSGTEPNNPMTSSLNHPVIVLEVTTPGKGNVSWNVNGQGGSDNGVTFPYRKELGPFDTGFILLSMVAQDTTGKAAPLKARILLGEKVFPCEGSGAYAVVTCTGSG